MKMQAVVLVAFGFAFSGLPCHAATVADIFGDHMVLQRDKPILVFGTGKPGEEVTVQFKGQTSATRVDDSGRWQVTLEALSTSAEPSEMTIDSDTKTRLKDILIGEVWLASGQSNMFWPVGEISNKRGDWPGVENGEEEVARADWPLIRLNSQLDHEFGIGGWRVCNPENVRGFSAVAYFFGREVHQELGVPVGLIARSFGGTTLQAWTPKAELMALPFVQKYDALYPKVRPQILEWNQRFRAYREELTKGAKPRPKRPDLLDEEIGLAKRLQAQGNLHARYIAPIRPFAIRGFIWYQGESQTIFKSLTQAMEDMLVALIEGRRRLWNDKTLPFYFVQLPIHDHPTKGTHWHIAREAMRRAFERTPHTGMAITYDFSDTQNVHPPEKQEVGRRLALWALAKTYDRDVVYSGPLFKQARFEQNVAVVDFDHAEGLRSSDGKPLRGFELASSDGEFHPATAAIQGEMIAVTAAQVNKPQAVRFFFGGFQKPNLVNSAGLPASPFTTEDWPGITQPKYSRIE